MEEDAPVTAAVLACAQIAIVLSMTGGVGALFRRAGQPRVVGEIAGGLLLGPLALGAAFPYWSAIVFPASGLTALELLSRIGLVLFLLAVGAELDLREVAQHHRATVAITVGSIALPFATGVSLSPVLFRRFPPATTSRVAGPVFLGIAMSVTALPVLAAILKNRNMGRHPVYGVSATQALLSAALNDLVAWCMLAAALTLFHGHEGLESAMLRLCALALFAGVMLRVVQPTAARLAERLTTGTMLPVLTVAAFVSAAVTEALGIHAFFGAFLAGICVPRVGRDGTILPDALGRALRVPIRVTLPVFFALTGLDMQRGMFDGSGLAWLGLVVVAAVAGKIFGGGLGARASGIGWVEAGRIGVLLNTRGLAELIVLNIGYREGILSPGLFTLFVLMALLTTLMTVPLLDLIEALQSSRIEQQVI